MPGYWDWDAGNKETLVYVEVMYDHLHRLLQAKEEEGQDWALNK